MAHLKPHLEQTWYGVGMNLEHAVIAPLPESVRKIVAASEREARLAHASAVNDETQESEQAEIKARLDYQDLCISLLVCTEYECYERTDGLFFCPEHREA